LNPYVFIVGCPRSGTTLLQRMVDAHPAIAVAPETHWIARSVKAGLVPDGTVTPALTEALAADGRLVRLGIGRDDLEALVASEAELSYAALVTAVFDRYGQQRGKALVGDKTPGYVRSISELHGLFPEARFVHLIRDGRDVCLSLMNWKRGPYFLNWFVTSSDPVSTSALWWESDVRAGREAGSELQPQLYHEVRYEPLIDRPEEVCAGVCRFLGLDYDPLMVRFHEGRTRHKPGLDAKNAWLPVTPGLRDWRRQMSREDAERFEALAGDLLDELGYARSVSRVSAAAARRAAELRSRFGEDVSRRGFPPPTPRVHVPIETT
jgi:hypothetical protein